MNLLKYSLNLLSRILIFAFLYIIVSLPLSFVTVFNQMQPLKSYRFIYVLLFFVIYGLLIFGLWWYMNRLTTDGYKKLTAADFGWSIVGWLAGRIVVTILTFVKLTIMHNEQLASANDQALDSLSNSLLPEFTPLFLISVVLLAPIAEELLFRGIFMNLFWRKHRIVGACFSAVVFASGHLTTSFIDFLMYASMGLMIALIYVKTKNMTANTLTHILNNSIASFFQ